MHPRNIKITNPPLQGTFGKYELEVAAAYIVLACQRAGSFGPCTFGQIAEVIADRVELMSDGVEMLDVDFHALVDSGFARWSSEEDSLMRTIEFTDLGLERVARHASPTAPA